MEEKPNFWGENLRDIILGGQDGLVNVLSIVLGMAAATHNTKIILVAGLAATFGESISMAAVGYTSMKAERDYHLKKNQTAATHLSDPAGSALTIGVAAIMGSFIPLLAFFWLPVSIAVWTSVVISALTLFVVGVVKAKLTIGLWYMSGYVLTTSFILV